MLSGVKATPLPTSLPAPLPAWPVAPVLLLALPWLNPVTFGPTHSVVQFLTVWVAAVLCWGLCRLARLEPVAAVQVVAAAWLLAASASACLGLLQYLGFAERLGPWLNYVEAGQAYANLRQRNQQATLLAVGLCALLWWQLQMQGHRVAPAGVPPPGPPTLTSSGTQGQLLARACFALVALLLASADAASGSRTGLLQLLLLLALGLLWRRGRWTLLLALLAYAAAALALPTLAGLDPLHSGILGRLGEVSAPCGSRLVLWSNVLQLIAQKPWTGWGWGELGYAHFITLYDGNRFCEILGNAHNLPLHLAAELGIPLAVLLCAGTLLLVLRQRPWREQDATRQMAWSVLAVIAAHSLLEYPLWYAPFQLAALLALWLLLQPRQVAGAATSALVCAVLLACSYAAWDYWRISQIYLSEAQRAPAYREDTLEKIRPSRLFADQVRFAELGVTPLRADNAAQIYSLALELLHFSPEASVVAKVIESARLLGQDDAVAYYSQRFEAAYPQEYVAWRTSQNARVQAP